MNTVLSLNSLCLPRENRFAKNHRHYSIIVIYDLENCLKCSENANHKKKKLYLLRAHQLLQPQLQLRPVPSATTRIDEDDQRRIGRVGVVFSGHQMTLTGSDILLLDGVEHRRPQILGYRDGPLELLLVNTDPRQTASPERIDHRRSRADTRRRRRRIPLQKTPLFRDPD